MFAVSFPVRVFKFYRGFRVEGLVEFRNFKGFRPSL